MRIRADNKRPGAARGLDCAIEQLTLNLSHAGHYPQYADAVSEIAEQADILLRAKNTSAEEQLGGRLAEDEDRYRRGLRDKQHLRLAELHRLLDIWRAAGKDSAELANIIAAGGAMDFNGRELGLKLDFRMADYIMFGAAGFRHPSTIRPCDATQAEIDAHLREDRKPRQNEARRRRYARDKAAEAARKAAAADLSCRKSAVDKALDVTIGGERLSVTELAAALEGGVAFMKPDGKRPLKGASLHKAIRRALKTLEGSGTVEITTKPARHGPDMWLARKLPS